MSGIRKYSTVSETTLDALASVVNKKIQQGWEPFGNLVTYKSDGKRVFCQPLVTGWNDLTDVKEGKIV